MENPKKILLLLKYQSLLDHIQNVYGKQYDISVSLKINKYDIDELLSKNDYDLIIINFDLREELEEQKDLIRSLTKKSVTARIIAFYNEASGKESIISYGVKRGIYDFYTDISGDSLQPEEIESLINNAKHLNDVKSFIFDEHVDEPEVIEKIITEQINVMQRQQLFCVTGERGTGVTSFAIDLAFDISNRHNLKTLLIDFDVDKADVGYRLDCDDFNKSLNKLIPIIKNGTLNNKTLLEYLVKPSKKHDVYVLNGFINLNDTTRFDKMDQSIIISICRNLFDIIVLNTSGDLSNPVVEQSVIQSSHTFLLLNPTLSDLHFFKSKKLVYEEIGKHYDSDKTSVIFNKYIDLKSQNPKKLVESIGFDKFYTIPYLPSYYDLINEQKVASIANEKYSNSFENITNSFFTTITKKKRSGFFKKKK